MRVTLIVLVILRGSHGLLRPASPCAPVLFATRPNAEPEPTTGVAKKKVLARKKEPITRGVVGALSLHGDTAAGGAQAYVAGRVEGEVTFTVYGEPVPLRRHMVSRGRMYNPSSTEQRNFARACALQLPEAPLTGPIEATLTFYFPRPASHYRTGRYAGELKPDMPRWHSKRKDLDNLVKFVLDSLNGLAYEDDSQVAVIRCAKFYTEGEPRTEARFRVLEEEGGLSVGSRV